MTHTDVQGSTCLSCTSAPPADIPRLLDIATGKAIQSNPQSDEDEDEIIFVDLVREGCVAFTADGVRFVSGPWSEGITLSSKGSRIIAEAPRTASKA